MSVRRMRIKILLVGLSTSFWVGLAVLGNLSVDDCGLRPLPGCPAPGPQRETGDRRAAKETTLSQINMEAHRRPHMYRGL